ncbi:hypothetical protein [Clostridium pasteurianum]|uniref:hypothetical protein n=1 Tax=Clostridium pasteurianum TaxID=1501 RepID=UPI00039F13A2|nr:hypothetical protein [Clostridium pasteurianum]
MYREYLPIEKWSNEIYTSGRQALSREGLHEKCKSNSSLIETYLNNSIFICVSLKRKIYSIVERRNFDEVFYNV